jgi:hypothetical protein
MPKTYKRRTRARGISQSRRKKQMFQSWLPYIALGFIILVAAMCLWSGKLTIGNQITSTQTSLELKHSSNYILTGKPSIHVGFINQILQHYHSPARGQGQTLYNLGEKYNIDPAYALAFFLEESRMGTLGVARVTHSLGNIRATQGHPDYHGYRYYKTWTEGFEDWYRLISQQYIQAWGLKSIDEIIPVYAPQSDNNDEAAYIQAVKQAVDIWRSGIVAV